MQAYFGHLRACAVPSQKGPFLEGVTKPDIEMLAANGNKVRTPDIHASRRVVSQTFGVGCALSELGQWIRFPKLISGLRH
jgi:hypothetical protein